MVGWLWLTAAFTVIGVVVHGPIGVLYAIRAALIVLPIWFIVWIVVQS